MLLWQVLSRGLTKGDTIGSLGLVVGRLEGGDSRENSPEYTEMRKGTHGGSAIPSSQPTNILRFVLVSINIGATIAESAIYQGREMLREKNGRWIGVGR